jgi:hypothetical protein
MTKVQLVMDYDVQRLDQMLEDAIRNVPPSTRRSKDNNDVDKRLDAEDED